MSNDPYSPYQSDDDELMNMFLQYGLQGDQNSMPGDTMAQKLNFYQDIVSTLGVDPIQQAGLGAEAQPVWVEPTSKARQVYGSNEAYSTMFDLIDQGYDPDTALAQVNERAKAGEFETITNWDDSEDAMLKLSDRANQYAFEKAGADQDRQAFEAKNAPSYTQADGSKYKNAPLGGNDIYATASEYDLLGAPDVDSVLQQYAQERGSENFYGKSQPGNKPVPKSKGDGRGATAPKMAGDWGYTDPAANKSSDAKRKAITPPERKLISGDKITDNNARLQVQKRINATKNNQVRSDANKNAMMRLMAFRTMIGS